MSAPHGIPTDLIDRLMIVRTLPYSLEEMVHILSIRAKVEGIAVEETALQFIGQIGSQTSLRYAVQLLTPANIIAEVNGREQVTPADVEEASGLFFDAKASAKLLAAHGDKYMSQ